LVPAAGLDLVMHLVDHDEGGEAMLTLAWIIVEEDLKIPANAIAEIRYLSDEVVDPADLPPSLDDHGN
jgi:hypothetical protein